MAKAIRTYEVTVQGWPPALYSARHPAKARTRCWRDYSHVDDRCSFGEFLKISSVRRVPDPPGVGQRILVGGLPATAVIGSCGNSVAFMRDDSDDILFSHPLDVTRPTTHKGESR